MFTLEQIREFILRNPVFSVDYPNRYLQNLGGQGDGISFTVPENPNLITVHFGAIGNSGNINNNHLARVYGVIHANEPPFHQNWFNQVNPLDPYLAALVLFMHNQHP
jgi:hypothetical protein